MAILNLGWILSALTASTLAFSHDAPNYPPAWWSPVERSGAPDWEILPQDAKPGEVILSKRTELGILSNFASTPFEYRGVRYASLEGFWQMMKFPENSDDPRANVEGWPHTRAEVAAMAGFDAKRAGNFASAAMRELGINWLSFEGRRFPYYIQERGEHYKLIVEATWAKLQQNPEVRRILLSTGDLTLKPDHHQEANSPPAWEYFNIYMEIRSKLQKKR